MNYGGAATTNVDGSGVFFPTGIQKVKLTDILFESTSKDGSGNKVLTVVFTNDDGAEEQVRLYPIDENKIKSGDDPYYKVNHPVKYKSTFIYSGNTYKLEEGKNLTSELGIAKAYYDFDVKVKHIITKFTDNSDLGVITSYEGLAKAVRDKLKPFLNTEEAKIEGLFIYDKKGFSHLAPGVPFLQKSGDNILVAALNKATKDGKLNKPKEPVADKEEIPFTPAAPTTESINWGPNS